MLDKLASKALRNVSPTTSATCSGARTHLGSPARTRIRHRSGSAPAGSRERSAFSPDDSAHASPIIDIMSLATPVVQPLSCLSRAELRGSTWCERVVGDDLQRQQWLLGRTRDRGQQRHQVPAGFCRRLLRSYRSAGRPGGRQVLPAPGDSRISDGRSGRPSTTDQARRSSPAGKVLW